MTFENPITKERIDFRVTGAETAGLYAEADLFVGPGGYAAAEHIHPLQEERFEIQKGVLRLWVDGAERELLPGDVALVPPGTPHVWENGGDDALHMLLRFTPALNTEEFFQSYFALAVAGRTNAKGAVTNPLQVSVLLQEFSNFIVPTRPPRWVQRALTALAPVAKRLGYRAHAGVGSTPEVSQVASIWSVSRSAKKRRRRTPLVEATDNKEEQVRKKIGLMSYRNLSRGASVAIVALALSMTAPAAIATFPGENGNIAFGRYTKGQFDIWVFNAKSGDKTRLTDTPRRNESMPDWNTDGTKLAFTQCGLGEFSNCDIWVMDADGGNKMRLTSTDIAQETWPTWSPDGSQIAYTSNEVDAFQDIWVMNADGTDPTLLTAGVEVFDAFPEWSPDGTKIAFTSDRVDYDDIWVMNVDGSDLVRLTTGGRKIDERPDWSPDGTLITFSRNGNIWIMDADGTNQTKVTSNKRHEFNPTFSPDGKLIAYNREGKDRRFGVWTMRTDGSGVKQRTSGLWDFFPDWQAMAPSTAE